MDGVALRKESVDRNPYLLWQFGRAFVALRKESVDRNTACRICRQHVIVALRKESVDRNSKHLKGMSAHKKSLSARRAWIEIPLADS